MTRDDIKRNDTKILHYKGPSRKQLFEAV